MFFPTDGSARQVFSFKACLKRGLNLGNYFLAVAPLTSHGSLYTACPHGVESLESKLLKLNADSIHAQPRCNRRVDIQRFAGYTATLFRCQHIQRPHIMETVGNFNQNNPQVFGHRHCHFLKIFSLGFGSTAKSDFVELAHAIDKISNGIAKLALDGGLGNSGIFDNIVQHGSHQALMVHMHFTENPRHGERVSYIGIAATTNLPVMGLFSKIISAADIIYLVVSQITGKICGQRVD